MSDLAELEQALFDTYSSDASTDAPAIFILGAPRTGSTFLYQAVTAAFELPCLNNLTNDQTPKTPIVGVMLSDQAWSQDPKAFTSAYGKTEGLMSPSEASAVMMNWFGGGHPSQINSADFSDDASRRHCIRTLSAVKSATGLPLVIKNAWNCFRIPALARALPSASFVWICRNAVDAATSDLAARKTQLGSGEIWTSATPANIEDLQKRPGFEQVIESQYEFSTAISDGLSALGRDRAIKVWYEDILENPAAEMERLRTWSPIAKLGLPPAKRLPELRPGGQRSSVNPDREMILRYAASQGNRLDFICSDLRMGLV